MAHELRERSIAIPLAPPDVTRAVPRRLRSPAVRTVALAVVASVSGAAAGAVVARHNATKTSVSAATPATVARLVAFDAASIAAAVAPAVVSIRTGPAQIGTLFETSASAGEGTGIVIRSDGTIVTDAALVAGTRPIIVRLGDGRSLPATVVGRDSASGIAVLKVAARGLRAARLATTDRLRVGDDVVALGDALALPGGPTVSRGVVAALHRTVAISTVGMSSSGSSSNTGPGRLTGLLEVTNALGAANAGGPVIDANGEVVGIATTAADGDRPPGFAIDVVRVRPVIRAIVERRAPTDALGVDAIDVTPDLAHEYGLPVESGALVAGVVPDSPAAAAGLLPDDIVVRLGHERVATAEDLAREARDPSASSMRLLVVRGRRTLALTVRLVH